MSAGDQRAEENDRHSGHPAPLTAPFCFPKHLSTQSWSHILVVGAPMRPQNPSRGETCKAEGRSCHGWQVASQWRGQICKAQAGALCPNPSARDRSTSNGWETPLLLSLMVGGTCRGPLGGIDKPFLLIPLKRFVLDSGIGGLQNQHLSPTGPLQLPYRKARRGERAFE